MAVHRGAEILAASLRSILDQTRRDFEVLVAGDGAADAVREAALSTGDPRIRWLGFPKAPGFGYSDRARAISRSRGRLIAYLAADDLWAPDHLERLVGFLEEERLDLAFSRPVLVWADGAPRPHFLPFDLTRGGPLPVFRLPLGLLCLSPTYTIHTREIHERAGGWADGLPRHGDVDLWLRCREAGARMGFLKRATTIRFPSYAFKGRPERHAELHGRYAERLRLGNLALDELRWAWPRRMTGWVEDILAAGLSRGPSWAGMLLRRSLIQGTKTARSSRDNGTTGTTGMCR